jgi:hypothetical protein
MNKHYQKHYRMRSEESEMNSTPGPGKQLTSFWPRLATKDELRDLLLRALAANNWTFLQFNDPDFIALVKRGFPHLEVPSRKIMRSYLANEAVKSRAVLKSQLEANDSKISIALDCWLSPNRINFMGTILLCNL